jgi:hypothetical protein
VELKLILMKYKPCERYFNTEKISLFVNPVQQRAAQLYKCLRPADSMCHGSLVKSRLRSQDTWHVHHWQSEGGSWLLSLPDTKEANEQKRLKRKEDKRRRQERQRVIRERQAQNEAILATSTSVPSRGRDPSQGNALLVKI